MEAQLTELLTEYGKIDGVAAGGVCTAPYQLNSADHIKRDINTVDISVVNTWVNRLIKDVGLPIKESKTWVSINPYNAQSPVEPSGLLRPVVIKSFC